MQRDVVCRGAMMVSVSVYRESHTCPSYISIVNEHYEWIRLVSD